MKKIYNLLMMAMMAAATCTMTSCDEDIDIANSLEGTWTGTMFVYTDYRGTSYYATSTEITFEGDPFRWTRGTGYWVDYYSGAPWDYVANHISWRVDNGNITVYFHEDGTSVVISNYRLNDSRFSGYIADGDNDVRFNLTHIASPNWNNYSYWGYDGWYDDGYYWSRGTRAAADDSLKAAPAEKPVRRFGNTPAAE